MRLRGLLLCLLATPALGQDQLIPKELVDGLLASRGVRQPVMFVGELPREMAGRIYVPKGARVLGGMSMGSSGTAVMLTNARREAVLAELEVELPRLGWKQFDPSMRVMQNAEFRDAPLPPGTMRISSSGPQQFCGASGGMSVNVEPVGFADTRITVTASDVNMCTAMSGSGSASSLSDRPELAMRPTFINPAGARNDMANCYRNSGDQFNWSSGGSNMLGTSMSPDALLEHYSKQLTDSGWTSIPIVKVARAWQKTDSTGKKVQYMMSIEAPANNPACRNIETRFSRSAR